MIDMLAEMRTILNALGTAVILPIIVFVLAIFMGTRPGRAFRAAVTIGIAFIGINLVIGLMWGSLSEVGQAMVENLQIRRDVVDVGWPSAAAIAFSNLVGLWVIPISIAVNIIFLVLNFTKTLNIDLWNYWHFAFIGAMVFAATGNLIFGLLSVVIAAAAALFFADWTAHAVQKYFDLPGISIPHLLSAAGIPFAIVVNWIVDRIPGLRKINVDPESIHKRFGVMGEPVILGLVIGILMGILGYSGEDDWLLAMVKILKTGMNLAAVILLLPRMVQLLMEGLIPVSEAARTFLQKRASGREIYIGLDSAILVGNPAVIASSLVLVPVAIILSIIIPGNRVILFADLAVLPFVVALSAPLMRGNIFRMILAGALELGVGFGIATSTAPAFTKAAQNAGFEMPANALQITSIGDGFLWPHWLFTTLISKLGYGGLGILALALAAAIYLFSKNPAAWEKLVGGNALDDR